MGPKMSHVLPGNSLRRSCPDLTETPRSEQDIPQCAWSTTQIINGIHQAGFEPINALIFQGFLQKEVVPGR